MHSRLKNLPSVEKVLEEERIASALNHASRNTITAMIREEIEVFRKRMIGGERDIGDEALVLHDISERVVSRIAEISSIGQKRVINATGVVLHTNLGRAILGERSREALLKAASGYVDLEMDILTGERIHRDERAVRLLTAVTGAEDALAVNNTAAAVLLAVNTFAAEGAVAVSRGELVEIGGSFRLPEILRSAAGEVMEIGTTNRTHLEDYEKAVDDGATLLLKVHTSNYRIMGYTNEVSLRDLSELGRSRGVPVMYDQGSGILFPLAGEGFEGEEDIGSLLETSVDMMSFSGDKVLGGPQSGIVLGRKDLLSRMKKNHLSRALRIDKLTLAALEAVLVKYWLGETEDIPVLRMIRSSKEEIGKRAEAFIKSLGNAAGEADIGTVEAESSIGGGSFPINPLPTILVSICAVGGRGARLASYLRGLDPAVLVRVKDESIFIDLRTVAVDEEDILRDGLIEGLNIVKGRE